MVDVIAWGILAAGFFAIVVPIAILAYIIFHPNK